MLPTGSAGGNRRNITGNNSASGGLLNRPDTLRSTHLDAPNSGQSLINQRTQKPYNPKKRDCLSFPGTDATNAITGGRGGIAYYRRSGRREVQAHSVSKRVSGKPSRPIAAENTRRDASPPGQREKARDCLSFPGTDATNAIAKATIAGGGPRAPRLPRGQQTGTHTACHHSGTTYSTNRSR